MKNIGAAIAAALGVGLAVVSCTEETKSTGVPMKGKVTYDIEYSSDLRNASSVGNFFPGTIDGVYDSTNFKLTAKAPLGLAKVDFVFSTNGDFALVEFDKQQMLIEIDQQLGNIDDIMNSMLGNLVDKVEGMPTELDDVKVTELEGETEIAGLMSRHVVITPVGSEDESQKIDIFYAPFDKAAATEAKEYIQERMDNTGLNLPGVITAFSISTGETNVMLMLTKIQATDDVSPETFARPNCPKTELSGLQEMLTMLMK